MGSGRPDCPTDDLLSDGPGINEVVECGVEGRVLVDSVTTTKLLDALLDPADEAVWREFDTRYRPILVGFARRYGLTHDQATDVAQETLARFAELYRAGRYQRERGRLRSWIIGIGKNLIREAQRGRRANATLPLDSVDLAASAEDCDAWERERRSAILRRALGELQRQTRLSASALRAFELVAIEGRDPSDVAAELRMTRHHVYVTKHRVTGQLRQVVRRLEEAYDDDRF